MPPRHQCLRETGAWVYVNARGCYPGAQLKAGRGTVKPNKLIISRKGFDSGSGGCPSPIFPDGTMFSLPIPSGDEEAFEDLQHGDVDIASVVSGITDGRMGGLNLIHLDPDLNFDAYRHRKERVGWQEWRGMLGQAGARRVISTTKASPAEMSSCSSASTAELRKLLRAGALSEELLNCTSYGAGFRSTRSIRLPTLGQMTSPGHAIIRTSSPTTATTKTRSTRRR